MHTKHIVVLSLLTASAVMLPGFVRDAATAAGNPLEVVAAQFDAGKPFAQDFVLTAYYSPEPDQCCYVKGTYEDDVILNGGGANGADGTPVYPGMVAAPPSYPFGARIALPGIGTVTVHDRGGAIQLQQSAHRLDVWMGSGELGLARALAFGVRRVRGTVYPPASPQPAESFSLSSFSAPIAMIQLYTAQNASLLSFLPKAGEESVGSWLLQERLKAAGYFQGDLTGLFGPVTQQNLAAFFRDAGLGGQSVTQLTESGAAFLEAAVQRGKAHPPIPAAVGPSSPPAAIASAKRTLRFLGYYEGRTNGRYDAALVRAVVELQKANGLVVDEHSPGAGRIGPRTSVLILRQWNRDRILAQARTMIAMHRVEELVERKGYDFHTTIVRGEKGEKVKLLQSFLVIQGLLPADRATGSFGAETQKALMAYQLASGIIRDPADRGAGTLGPATALHVRVSLRDTLYRLVRSRGWDAI